MDVVSLKHMKYFARCLLLVVISLLMSAPARCNLILKKGDRIVFLGDSITEQRLYTRFVMNYLTLHYPELDLSYRNAGWVSDTAPGGLKRLQRDVLSLHPTVVTICYGMNDGGVTDFKPAIYQRFLDAMTDLVRTLKRQEIKVALLTPGIVDPDRKNWNSPERMRIYNPTLARFAEGIELLAKREKVSVFSIHKVMLDAQTAAKAGDPNWTMIPDGVHPNTVGHALMACGLLRAFGCAPAITPIRVTVNSTGTTARNFTGKTTSMPEWLDESAQPAKQLYEPLAELDNYSLQVKGLPPGNWRLSVNKEPIADFTATALARGVALANIKGPWLTLANQISELNKQQETLYFMRWRKVQLADPPGNSEELTKLDQQISATENQRRKLNGQKSWRWELTSINH